MAELDLLKIVYIVGWALIACVRIAYYLRARSIPVVDDRRSAWERSLLALLGAGFVVLPLIRVFSPWLGVADYRLPPWAGWTGAACLTASAWLLWRAHAALGRHWSDSVQLRQGHDLVTSGVYRLLRHPMYASGWLFGIAQALLLQNWIVGSAGLVSFALL